ncbi:hypothetical protein M9H77_34127 [Catharanthus roseus]|uniref:Uncharacterized protein n=1 Tax=Catharanthus roseus TaxID=4058 RepID=A0ACB9ZPI7_CATRO|nr:hypothetical protein M9H77_34127 [Catharanthus roseus]
MCYMFLRKCIGAKHQRIVLYVASPPYEGLFQWRERFKLKRVDPLKEGRKPRRMWPNRSMWTPHHTLRWVRPLSGESGGSQNQGWSQGRPSRPCSWSPTVAFHVSLNSGVEAALMCVDSLKLPSCTRNPHVGIGKHSNAFQHPDHTASIRFSIHAT